MEDNRYLYQVANKFIRDEEESLCRLLEIIGYENINSDLDGSNLKISAYKYDILQITIRIGVTGIIADMINFFVIINAKRGIFPNDIQEVEIKQSINIGYNDWDKLDRLASDMISHVSHYKWFEQ